MRWLITGSYGQLGTDLQAVLAATPEDVVRAVDLDVLDITDAAAVDRAIAEFAPDVLVNAADEPMAVLRLAASGVSERLMPML